MVKTVSQPQRGRERRSVLISVITVLTSSGQVGGKRVLTSLIAILTSIITRARKLALGESWAVTVLLTMNFVLRLGLVTTISK